MLRPITVAPMLSNHPSTIGVLAFTSPPSSPCERAEGTGPLLDALAAELQRQAGDSNVS
jgi:hypothetical protein